MKRYAFVRHDIPEMMPRIMVVIVQATAEQGVGEVVDSHVCEDQTEVDAYMLEMIGPSNVCYERGAIQ